MTAERIKELQEQTGYPQSISVYKALLQVWNECEQEQLRIADVVGRSEQFCECDGVQDLIAGTGECRKCGGQCTY